MIVLWLQSRHYAGHRLWHVHMRAMRSGSCDTHLFLSNENPVHDVSILRWMILMSLDAIIFISVGAAFGGLVNGLAGFGNGLFALAGLSGALPTIWSALHNGHKREQRAVLQPFNVLILSVMLLGFA